MVYGKCSLTLHNWNNADNTPNDSQFHIGYYYGSTTNDRNLLTMSEQNSPAKLKSTSSSLSQAITTTFAYDGVNRLSSVTDDSGYASLSAYVPNGHLPSAVLYPVYVRQGRIPKKFKAGFIDREGKDVIEACFDDAEPFRDGLASVQAGGRWGAINLKGELVIPCTRQGRLHFDRGLSSYADRSSALTA
jgi:hypothetical protein